MSANGISTLATKELKQKAKLDLAATNRAADSNPRATYDITQLPTQYEDDTVTDNANSGGLVLGRPWTTGSVTALFVSLGAEFEIRVDDTTGISPGMIMTGMDYGGATVTVVTVNSSTSLEMSIIAPDTVPAPGTVLTFTNPTYIAGAATKAARAVAKLAWANYVQDYREAYRVGDSSGPPEFPDGGEIDYADD